jgi:hypothetical protein
LSSAITAALVLWLFFAASAVRVLRDRGAPVAHGLTVFLAPLGYRPGFRSLFYLLSGRYRSPSDTTLSAIDSVRRFGLVIVSAWFVVVGTAGALWFARAL